MPAKLTCPQSEQLDEQMSWMPSETDPEGEPGERIHLIALLNKFGYSPMSKQEALRLA
jgi:hypothetical protein